jgi:sugar phosphate permease
MLFTNKAYMLLLCAALFRFAGGYSLGFWAKQYFSGVYGDYDD